MFRLFEIKDLSARKKLLLAQSDLHRHTLLVQAATLQHTAGLLKRRYAVFGISSVALSVGASIAGLLMAKQKPEEGKRGIFSKVLSSFSAFTQIRSLMSRLKSNPGEGA